MRFLILTCVLMSAAVHARIVSEQEPNNGFAQANLIECGDTVLCAHLDISDGDFFRLFVPGGDSIYFRTFSCGTNENTVILLYDSTYALLGINDDSGPGEFSALGAFLPFNQLCYLQVVDPSGSSTGGYTLTVECMTLQSGPHDLCSAARPVTFFPYYDESSTFGAGSEIGTASPDVFYQLSLATPGDVFIRVCSDGFNARVQLILFCVGGLMDDSFEGNCEQGADLSVFGLQAQTYYIYVEGTAANQSGEFSIEIIPLLQNCPAPQNLIIFSVGGFPFLDWPEVPEADYFLIEQANGGEGPFEALATTTESFWQDPLGFALTRRFYRVRSICE